MGTDDRLMRMIDVERRASLAADRAEAAVLHGGGGGGTSGGVEERVTRLERNVDQLAKDVGDLRVSLATLTERVAHLPGKGFIVTATSTTIAIIGGLVVFADKLRVLLGG